MADIPSRPTDTGGLDFAPWEEGATRPIVGWARDSRMTQALTLTALDRAVARPRPPAGVRHPADRGSP